MGSARHVEPERKMSAAAADPDCTSSAPQGDVRTAPHTARRRLSTERGGGGGRVQWTRRREDDGRSVATREEQRAGNRRPAAGQRVQTGDVGPHAR
jgi:hypothetical protein